MKSLVFDILLEEPVLIASLLGDANTETSLSYIPGTVLRGAVISKRANGSAPLNCFFDGSVRFLNAYPVVDGKHFLPRPLSWVVEKGGGDGIRDLAVLALGQDGAGEHDKIWVSAGGEYAAIQKTDDDVHAYLKTPDRHIQIHTARNRKYGRSLGANAHKLGQGNNPGAIFRYDSIASGQIFRSAVLCDDAAKADEIKEILEKDIFLGGARTAGYGKVRISNIRMEDGGGNGVFDECAMKFAPPPQIGEEVVVCFLSDALVRDSNGQLTFDRASVAQSLGIELNCGKTFIKSLLVAGYNRKWRLPLTQDMAMMKGSVIAGKVIDSKKFIDALERGVGERISEGFGRICIDWLVHETYKKEELQTPTPKAVTIQTGTPAHALAQRIVDRTVRRHWDRELAAKSHRDAKDFSQPSKSQLGRVRAIVQSAMQDKPDAGSGRIKDIAKDIHARKSSRDQWDGQEKHLEKYTDQSKPIVDPKGLVLGGVSAKALTSEDCYRANMRLLNAALAVASKKKRSEK